MLTLKELPNQDNLLGPFQVSKMQEGFNKQLLFLVVIVSRYVA